MPTIQYWLNLNYFNNTIKDYTLAVISLVGLVFIFALLKRLLTQRLKRLAQTTAQDFDDFLVDVVGRTRPIVLAVLALYISTLQLTLNDTLTLILHHIMVIVMALQIVYIIERLGRYAVEKIYIRARPDDPSAEAVSKTISKVFKFAIWALGAVFVLDNLGVKISALVAGVGIGGIAIAMASQAVLGDALSALSIYIDKPFEVGDFIIVGDMLGSVEHVGLKTTRIRSLFGEQLIFSNSDLTSSRIKNYKRMEVRRISFKIGVTYQTSAAKVKKIPGIVRDICSKIEGIKLDRVHFLSFGDYSLMYEIVYYVLSPDYNIYMDKQQEINFALKDEFEKEKIEFAYPTQTLFVTKEGSKS